MRRKLLYVWTLCLLILVLGSIPVYAKKPVMTYQELTMCAGKKATFEIDGNRKKAKWTSSKHSVAVVSKKGIVKAKKPGKCTIKAVLKNKTFIFKLTVKKKKSDMCTAVADDNMPAVSDSNDISVKVQLQTRKKPKKSEANARTLGVLVSYNAQGKVIRSFLVDVYDWKINTEHDSKSNTYTIKIGFWMKKWGWAEVYEPDHSVAPCYFSWEVYNNRWQRVQSGKFDSGPARMLRVFRGPLIIKGLKEGSYTVRISSYREKYGE